MYYVRPNAYAMYGVVYVSQQNVFITFIGIIPWLTAVILSLAYEIQNFR